MKPLIDPQKSRLSLTVAGWLSLVSVVFAAGWRIGSYVRDIRDDVAKVREEIWTAPQQERWAYQLEKANRDKGLIVPEPREIPK